MPKPKNELHPREEIRDYIVRNFPELANAKSMSVGFVGGNYRITVSDSQHVDHIIKIDPKDIDADRKKNLKNKAPAVSVKGSDKARVDGIRKAAAAVRARTVRDNDRDHER